MDLMSKNYPHLTMYLDEKIYFKNCDMFSRAFNKRSHDIMSHVIILFSTAAATRFCSIS